MRIYRILFRQARTLVEEKLDHYSQFNPSPLSMQQFTDFGKYYKHIYDNHIYVSEIVLLVRRFIYTERNDLITVFRAQ